MSIVVVSDHPNFQGGTSIRLADDQFWIFPAPPGIMAGERTDYRQELADDPEYLALLQAVREAEDHAEQLRAELVLMIHLLSWNYELGPEDYQRLLSFKPNSQALAAAQQSFHQVTCDHLHRQRELKPNPRSNQRQTRDILHLLGQLVERIREWRFSRIRVPLDTLKSDTTGH